VDDGERIELNEQMYKIYNHREFGVLFMIHQCKMYHWLRESNRWHHVRVSEWQKDYVEQNTSVFDQIDRLTFLLQAGRAFEQTIEQLEERVN